MGIKLHSDLTMHIHLNGEDLGIAATINGITEVPWGEGRGRGKGREGGEGGKEERGGRREGREGERRGRGGRRERKRGKEGGEGRGREGERGWGRVLKYSLLWSLQKLYAVVDLYGPILVVKLVGTQFNAVTSQASPELMKTHTAVSSRLWPGEEVSLVLVVRWLCQLMI